MLAGEKVEDFDRVGVPLVNASQFETFSRRSGAAFQRK